MGASRTTSSVAVARSVEGVQCQAVGSVVVALIGLGSALVAPSDRANKRTLDADALAARLGLWSSGPGPLYQQLTDGIASLARSGVLRGGDRLPAERSLATCLSVSRGTVVAAYDALRELGVVDREQGRGTTVRADPSAIGSTHDRPAADALFQGAASSIDMLMAVPEVLPEVVDRISAIDLTDPRDVIDSAGPPSIPAPRRANAERMQSGRRTPPP